MAVVESSVSVAPSSFDLSSLSVFEGLERSTLKAVESASDRLQFPAGTVIFTEKDQSEDFYLIETGRVAVFRGEGAGGEYPIVELGPGEVLGEFAMMVGGKRSASARAACDTTLIRISPDRIREQDAGDRRVIELRSHLAAEIVGQIRKITDSYLDAVRRELDAIRVEKQSGYFLVFLIVLFSISSIFSYVILEHIVRFDYLVSWEYMLMLCAPGAILIWVMKVPLRECGITTVGLRKSVSEGLMASAAVFVLAFGGAYVFNRLQLGRQLTFHRDHVHYIYILSAFLQEFMARGVFQNSVQRFLGDKRGYISVVMVSVMFSLFHIQFGLPAVALVFAGSFVFGAFYLRHQNLAGVTLLHASLGYVAFGFGVL